MDAGPYAVREGMASTSTSLPPGVPFGGSCPVPAAPAADDATSTVTPSEVTQEHCATTKFVRVSMFLSSNPVLESSNILAALSPQLSCGLFLA